jgi:hypothetical protein
VTSIEKIYPARRKCQSQNITGSGGAVWKTRYFLSQAVAVEQIFEPLRHQGMKFCFKLFYQEGMELLESGSFLKKLNLKNSASPRLCG